MDQKIKTSDSYPYFQYEKTKEWNIVKKALYALEKNNDIKFTTKKEYVIGFLTEQLLKEQKSIF
jgi:hypothetical protein